MIQVSEPNLDVKDAAAVIEAVRSTQISGNSALVSQFEAAFASYCGATYGIACNSGASALHIALLALGIGRGDEVIVPDVTMIATANAVSYCWAKPVFVDSDPDTWCINTEKIEEKINSHTRAIIPVHLYGHPCDMDVINELARKHDLLVVEDAAEAIGSEYKNRKTGVLGNVACFSFYANKNITTGEGGMVTTNDKEIADDCRALRAHAFGVGNQHFQHTCLGFSYRMSGLQAALGISQTERIEELVMKKRTNGKFYNSFLQTLAGTGKITLPVEKPWAKNTYWYYTILINLKSNVTRDELMEKLFEDKIETRTAFVPMHKQQIYRAHGNYPFAELIAQRGINLPSSSRLKPEEIMYICECIKKHVG